MVTEVLHPSERQLMLDALRPPEGYVLDYAVGTTYSLDLLALLTAQVAFTLFDWQDENGRPTTDPLALLEAVRRNADKLCIFCQSGEIAVPSRFQLLLGYLEDSIIEVASRIPHGVFHPKLWALRFVAPDEPVFYRIVCTSRNITFDRSWDVVLALEGELQERRNAISSNHPLGDFLAALPDLTVGKSISRSVRSRISQIEREIRKVAFMPPEPFQEVKFWPIGIEGAPRWPFKGRIDRMLVISPFLSPKMLARLTEGGKGHVLVSRLDSLQSMDRKALRTFKKVFFMNPDADAPEDVVEEPGNAFTGLHAKVYVADAGWDASVWVGSANATHEAFNGNVEFLTELIGMKSQCGIDAVLGLRQDGGFDTLLLPFAAGDLVPVDSTRENLERLLQGTRRHLAEAQMVMRVSAASVGQEYVLTVTRGAGKSLLPPNVVASCWPISLREVTSAKPIRTEKEVVAEFGPVSFEAITPFLAINLTVSDDATEVSSRFVLNLPLEGAPPERRDALLRVLLKNRGEFIRLLLLILSEGGPELQAILGPDQSQGNAAKPWLPGLSGALFEAMVRALEKDPRRLDQVARVLDDLTRTAEGRQLLPEGLESIWTPIWQARQRLIK